MQDEDQMDWDDAYANAAHIFQSDSYPPRWQAQSRALLDRWSHQALDYGPHPRQQMDLVFPKGTPLGLMVYIHGGYWLRFDRSYWTFLAEAALHQGYAVAMPSYPLCPEVTIAQITTSVAQAVQMAADAVPGPIRLTGHSAGGHLAARMLCSDVALPCRARIVQALLISPLTDLRHMQKTAMAEPLQLTDAAAAAESPVLHAAPSVPVTLWVGGAERPVFLDHAAWLAKAWDCPLTVEPGKHHFDVIDGLADADHPLFQALFS